MSWNKIANREVGSFLDSLGVRFLNKNLKMMVEDYKVECLLELLKIALGQDVKGLKFFWLLSL